MAIDPKIFTALGIKTVEQKLNLLNSYPQRFTDADIQADLIENIRLKKIAYQKTIDTAENLGIDLATNEAFAENWDPYKNEFKISARLAEDPNFPKEGDKPYYHYDGRAIETHLQNTASNGDFNPNDIMDTFNSILQAADALVPSDSNNRDKYVLELKSIREEFLEDAEYSIPHKFSRFHRLLNRAKSLRGLFATKKEGSTSRMDLLQDASFRRSGSLNEFLEATSKKGTQTSSIQAISKDLELQLQSGGDLKNILQRYAVLNEIFIGRLAIALAQANENTFVLDEMEKTTYEKYVKQIQEKQIEIVSEQKRPIIVNIYKQNIEDPQPNTAYYTLVTHTPNSDVSSASRSLENLMFSNDWTVTVERISIKTNPDGTTEESKSLIKKYIRSSSIARITYEYAEAHRKDKDFAKKQSKEEFEHVYEAFRNLIVQYAREELIRKINADEVKKQVQEPYWDQGRYIIPEAIETDIDKILKNNTLVIKEAYLTLLSPLISKEAGIALTSRLGKTVTTKTIYENEDAQLEMTRKCLAFIATDPELKFDDNDAAEILRRTEKKRIKKNIHLTTERITGLKLQHKSYYSNYMVNKLSFLRSEKIDFIKRNKEDYLAGNALRRKCIVEFIQESEELKLSPSIKIDLISIFDPSVNDQKSIGKQLALFKKEYAMQLRTCPNIVRVIDLYSRVEEYYEKVSPTADLHHDLHGLYHTVRSKLGFKPSDDSISGRISASYITANVDLELATLLGYMPHFTCKSGVDRTGLFASFVEAISACKDVLNVKIKFLEQAIIASLKHGANRLVKCCNLPGIAGLQIPENAITTMHDLCEFIASKRLGQIGKMGKVIFAHGERIFIAAKRSAKAAWYNTNQELESGNKPPLVLSKPSSRDNLPTLSSAPPNPRLRPKKGKGRDHL